MSLDMDRIRTIKDTHQAHLLSLPGVTGVDIGFKYVGGQRTDEVVIRVHVKEKRDVPQDQRIPAMLEGIRTDVLPAESKIVSDDGGYTVLQGGISLGRLGSLNKGTFGAVTIDNATGTQTLLTNYHVLCHSDGTWEENDLATQPGASLCTIGPLMRAIFEGGETQAEAGLLDAAVAGIKGGHGSLPARANLSWIVDVGPVAGAAEPTLGMLVRKRGRVTELTSGAIDGMHGTKQTDYSEVGMGKRWMKDVTTIEPSDNPKFDDAGDSGSVVVNGSNEVVALIFGAEAPSNRPEVHKGLATPIAPVLSRMGVSLAITGLFADSAGWDQAQYYSTIQTAVYNGQLWLLARAAGSAGLLVYNWDDGERRFLPRSPTGLFNDANGWNKPQYYETLQTVVHDTSFYLLARGAGDGGLQVYTWNDQSQTFDLVTSTGLFSDTNGWDKPQYYSTIQTAVNPGNNALLLLARGAGSAGLQVYQWDSVTSRFQLRASTGLFTDEGGWNQPQYYSTIQTAVDPGNDDLLLLARGAGEAGLQVYQWNDSQEQFTLLASTGLFTDGNGWNQPQYYSTIQTAIHGGVLLLLARGAGDAGLQVYQWDGAQRRFTLLKSTGLFTDADGWNQPQYYSTIQTSVFNSRLFLLARGAGQLGLLMYRWDDGGQTFLPYAVGNAPVVAGLFRDADGWNKEQYYATIQTAALSNGQLLLLARGAGNAGLVVFQSSSGTQFEYLTSTGLFTDASGWNKQQYYSTIQTVVYSDRLLLLARGAGDAGLQVYEWDGTQLKFNLLKLTGLFTDINGWDKPEYYSTIQTVVAGGELLLLARGAGEGGLQVYQWNDSQEQFTLLASTGLFADDNGWDQEKYYSTIQTAIHGSALLLLARGAGDAGLQVYQWDGAQRRFTLLKNTGLFTDADGWDKPQYYSTIQTFVDEIGRLLLLTRSAGNAGLVVYQWNDAQTQFQFVGWTGLFPDNAGWDQAQYYTTIHAVVRASSVLLLAREPGDGGLLVYLWDISGRFTLISAYNSPDPQRFFYGYSALKMGLFCRAFQLDWWLT